MGWARGEDPDGRPIGYAVEATCEHPGCKEKIDRGLSYKCGGQPGSDGCCLGYFCEKHMTWNSKAGPNGIGAHVCFNCSKIINSEARRFGKSK